MADLSIDERLKRLLDLKESDPDGHVLIEAKAIYQKFENALTFQDAKQAINDLVSHIKRFHYQDMRPSTPQEDKRKKEEIEVFESLLIADMERRFERMSNFFREQQIEKEAEQFLEAKTLSKNEMEKLVKFSYELARAVEEQKKKTEYEKLIYHSEKPVLFSLEKKEWVDTFYSKIREKVTETMEEIFRKFGVERPITEAEGKLYKEAEGLLTEYQYEKNLDKADYLVDRFVNLCKIYNYSHYDEYGNQDKKDPSFFAQMAEELKAKKREELSLSSGFDFFKTIEKFADKLKNFIDDLIHKEDVEQTKSSQFRPEPPKK